MSSPKTNGTWWLLVIIVIICPFGSHCLAMSWFENHKKARSTNSWQLKNFGNKNHHRRNIGTEISFQIALLPIFLFSKILSYFHRSCPLLAHEEITHTILVVPRQWDHKILNYIHFITYIRWWSNHPKPSSKSSDLRGESSQFSLTLS